MDVNQRYGKQRNLKPVDPKEEGKEYEVEDTERCLLDGNGLHDLYRHTTKLMK